MCELGKLPKEDREKQKKRFGKCWKKAKRGHTAACHKCCDDMGLGQFEWVGRPEGRARLVPRLLALALALTGVLLAIGCTGPRSPRGTPAREWRVYAICVTEDGSKAAFSAIRSGPGEPGYSYEFALLIVDTRSGRILYSHADRRFQDIPLDWMRNGPRLLVSRVEMADSDWPASGIFALDTATGRRDRMVPHMGTEKRGYWSPGYKEVVYELRPIVSRAPLKMRPGAPGVYAATDAETTHRIAERAYLVAVVPAGRRSQYRAFIVRDETLFAVSVPSMEESTIFPSSIGIVGGYSVSPDGKYAAGLIWKEDDETSTRLAIQRLDSAEEPTLVQIPASVGRTAWAAKAEALACIGNGGLWVYHLKDGRLARVGPNQWKPSACAWLPDGKRLLIGCGPEVLLVDSETGRYKVLLRIRRDFSP